MIEIFAAVALGASVQVAAVGAVPAPAPGSTQEQETVQLAPAEPATIVPASSAVPKSEKGQIIIYRSATVVGAAVGCPVRYKGHEIVELGRGKIAEWQVAPGRTS